jgi:hypothetical protein
MKHRLNPAIGNEGKIGESGPEGNFNQVKGGRFAKNNESILWHYINALWFNKAAKKFIGK